MGVKRTFSWQGQNRRLSKDYELLCTTSEAFIYVAMIRLMVRRLARPGGFSKRFLIRCVRPLANGSLLP